jgi:hypothetical protein
MKLENFLFFFNFYLFENNILIKYAQGHPEGHQVDTRFVLDQKF